MAEKVAYIQIQVVFHCEKKNNFPAEGEPEFITNNIVKIVEHSTTRKKSSYVLIFPLIHCFDAKHL